MRHETFLLSVFLGAACASPRSASPGPGPASSTASPEPGAAATAAASVASLPRLRGEVPMDLVVRGSSYRGSASIDDRGAGIFTATGPVQVTGTVHAREKGDSVTIDLAYAIAANNCRGTMRLIGAFKSPPSQLAEGSVEATDSCVGRMTGTFRAGR